jgi:rod shape-determining protein MreC
VSYFRSPTRLLIMLLLIAVVFFVLYGVGWLQPVVGYTKVVFSPIQRFFTATGDTVAGWFSFVGDISEMDESNKSLRQQVDDLRSENTKLREMVHQNELLREEIGFQNEFAYETRPAAVISRSNDPALQVVEINIGTSQGVKTDMPVIVSAGLLVGKVVTVRETTATVQLLIDRQSSVNALVQDTRANGIVSGKHGLDLKMDLIPQNEGIEPGQSVVTSGLEGIYPGGLLVGQVDQVQESQNALFKEARLIPVVDFSHLEIVFVVLGTK